MNNKLIRETSIGHSITKFLKKINNISVVNKHETALINLDEITKSSE